jgi:hypothetical protein
VLYIQRSFSRFRKVFKSKMPFQGRPTSQCYELLFLSTCKCAVSLRIFLLAPTALCAVNLTLLHMNKHDTVLVPGKSIFHPPVVIFSRYITDMFFHVVLIFINMKQSRNFVFLVSFFPLDFYTQ